MTRRYVSARPWMLSSRPNRKKKTVSLLPMVFQAMSSLPPVAARAASKNQKHGEKGVVWSLFAGRTTLVISPIFIGGRFLRATDGTRVAVDLGQQRSRFRRRRRRGRPWRHRSWPKENESWRCEC